MRYRPTLVFFVLLMTIAAAPALAQIPGWNSKQFTYERLDADRWRLIGEIEIEGAPGGANAGQKFFADELELNTNTGELIARGSVTFRTPTAQISADTVTFNTRTRLGTFENASGIAQLGERGVRDRSMFGTLEPDIYFRGESIEKVGADKYRIRNGAFTTCVQPTPRWEIVSGNATINLQDYAMLRNAVIRVKDVPVFYLPFIYYPIQDDDRATGFLLPVYGTSLARGNSISNAFFWAINRSMDATVFHDWMFSRGSGMGVEYRYLLASQSQGQFQYYRLDEKETLINGRPQAPRKSTKITGGLSQGLGFGLAARARVDYFTDITVQQLYNNNFAQASLSTRTFDGGISGAWRSLTMNGRYQRIEYFDISGNSTTNGQEPGFTAAINAIKLGPLPVFASINADAGRVIYRLNDAKGTTLSDLSLMKADVVPSLRAALSTLPFLQVNATASYRTTYFSESLAANKRTQIETPITRRYADMRLDVVGPVFSKVFNPNNAFADRLKHVIEPSYSVQRRTEISAQDFIPTTNGGYDTIIGGTTQMSYGLANRILARKGSGDTAQASGPRELLTVNLRQSYYTDARASQFDTAYSYGGQHRKPSPFSPISLTARASPTAPIAIDFRMEYDPTKTAEKKLLGMGLNGVIRTGVLESTTGWFRQAFGNSSTFGRSNNYMNHGMALRFLDGRIGGHTAINFDIGLRKLYNHRYVAYYNAQCCGISFEFQSFDYSANTNILVPKDRRFNMSFTLAGVGSFSNFFGAFGGGTY